MKWASVSADCTGSDASSRGVLIGRTGQKEQSEITAITRRLQLSALITALHMQPSH